MLKKILMKIDPEAKVFNTGFFNYVLIFTTICLLYISLLYGGVAIASIISIASGSFTNLAMFLVAYFGIMYFKMGAGRDIAKEIYDENNMAAATYEGLLALAIATVIAKGLL